MDNRESREGSTCHQSDSGSVFCHRNTMRERVLISSGWALLLDGVLRRVSCTRVPRIISRRRRSTPNILLHLSPPLRASPLVLSNPPTLGFHPLSAVMKLNAHPQSHPSSAPPTCNWYTEFTVINVLLAA
jgi:hypothetical protein